MSIEPFMLTIPAEGPQTVAPLAAVPGLEAIKAGLDGGLLEVVPLFATYHGKPCLAFCDEEGKLKGLRFNHAANILWAEALGGFPEGDFLVGPIVVIVGPQDFLDKL